MGFAMFWADGVFCGIQIKKFYIKIMDATKSKNAIKTPLKVRAGPAGVHFFNREIGMNVLIDEFKPPLRLWSKAPRQVSIALTNSCDLTCPHCYAPKKSAMLNYDSITHWLTELDANGCLGVGFGGGEPTLYPRLAELCFFVTQRTQLATTMTTHAHHLSQNLLKSLEGNLNFVRVSMDGVGKTYEFIRRRSFNQLIDHIVALRSIVRFGINFVVNSRTFSDIDAAIHLAENLGAAEFLLLPEEPVRGIGGTDSKTRIALQEWVLKYPGNIPLSISEAGAEGFPTCNPLSIETGLSAFAHIDASGYLKRTSYDETGVQILGGGVMKAIDKLKTKPEVIHENME